jgi:hypothetical protein
LMPHSSVPNGYVETMWLQAAYHPPYWLLSFWSSFLKQ